jgi:hypothetical protein
MTSSDLRGLVAQAGANDAWYEDAFLPGRPVRLWSARPKTYAAKTPLLFVHHGDLRNGGEFRNSWLPLVDEIRILVIAPEFSATAYQGPEWYTLGNRVDAEGRKRPREQWTYGVPQRIFAALGQQGITARSRYGLFGHSSGGQFVHRAISLGFRNDVAAAATANAGTYAMPSFDVDFPYGLANAEIDEAALRALLAFRLTIFAGTADIDMTADHFPREAAAMRQGPTRYARAHAYLAAARDMARKLKVSCAWTLIEVPDVGHDGGKMSAAAAAAVAAELYASES